MSFYLNCELSIPIERDDHFWIRSRFNLGTLLVLSSDFDNQAPIECELFHRLQWIDELILPVKAIIPLFQDPIRAARC